MTTWIFQANPHHYDIDAVLEAGVPQLLFTVEGKPERCRRATKFLFGGLRDRISTYPASSQKQRLWPNLR
ncbi:MAG: hypothetical protein KKB02_10735 [Alphaproteobacteria bacterium]|nr:hypothetical protein [Alphaproteobacteria bacterium]